MKFHGKRMRMPAILLAAAIILSCPAYSTARAEGAVTVSLRVEGIERSLYYNSALAVPDEDGQLTVAEVVAYADTTPDSPGFTLERDGYGGVYLSSVAGESEATFGGYDGWMFRVNGVAPSVGMNATEVGPGDSIVLYYSDEFGAGMQFPAADTSQLGSAGKLVFTSSDTAYDADWNPTVSVNPVAGAAVTWYNGDAERIYTTDENGAVTLDATDLTEGVHRVQIEKYSDKESGGKRLPLVLRLAPDFTVTVPAQTVQLFDDVDGGAWYAEYVNDLASKGILGGRTASLFEPGAPVKRAELVKMLAAASGTYAEGETSGFTDVSPSAWYAPYVAWAAVNGIVAGRGDGTFGPEDEVSRQDAAVMLVNFLGRTGKTLPASDAAVQFADADRTADYAVAAVDTLAQAGILQGRDGGLLEPGASVLRREAAKLLSMLINQAA